MTETQVGRFSRLFIDRPDDRDVIEAVLTRVETSLEDLDVSGDKDAAWYLGEAARIAERENLDTVARLLTLMNCQIPVRFVLEYIETQPRTYLLK